MTILTSNAVVRLMADTRAQQSIAVLGSPGPVSSALFDTPPNLAFGTGAGEQQNLFVTNLGWMRRFIPAGKWPGAALREMEREPDPLWRLYGVALAYHAAGRQGEEDAALAALIRDYGETMAVQIAEVFAYRGDVDRSFEYLDRAFAVRDGGMADIKNNPLLENLQGDARYAALLKRMRLPAAAG
jgi:hypothetical protein